MSSTVQALIDAANPGDTVKVPAGQYDVDTNTPITLKSDITLDLTGAVLVALPTDKLWSRIVEVGNCNNVTIIGGVVSGERDIHLGPTVWNVGGGGGGIFINGATNVKVQGTTVRDCFGDGIQVLDGKSIKIGPGVVCDRNRRQGMSVINCDGLHVYNCQFSNNGGTPPGDGIDLECDLETQAIRNVLIEKSVFYGNEGAGVGVGAPGTYANIHIAADNSFDMKTQPIWVSGNARPLGTPWWALTLNRLFGTLPSYRWWGYRTDWYHA